MQHDAKPSTHIILILLSRYTLLQSDEKAPHSYFHGFLFGFIFTQGQTEGQLKSKQKKYVNMLLLWAES